LGKDCKAGDSASVALWLFFMPASTKRSSKPNPRDAGDAPSTASLGVWISRAAFVLALGLVLTRATMTETLRDSLDVLPGSQPMYAAPGPGTSLVLDLVAWIPALLVLTRAAFDRSYAMRFLDGAGARAPGGAGTGDDTYSEVLTGGGLPPSPMAGLVDIGGAIVPVCLGCGERRSAFEAGSPSINPNPVRRKLYWKFKNDK